MRLILLLIVAVVLTGCGASVKPYSYADKRELSDEPGVFTGPSGAFTLYRK